MATSNEKRQLTIDIKMQKEYIADLDRMSIEQDIEKNGFLLHFGEKINKYKIQSEKNILERYIRQRKAMD